MTLGFDSSHIRHSEYLYLLSLDSIAFVFNIFPGRNDVNNGEGFNSPSHQITLPAHCLLFTPYPVFDSLILLPLTPHALRLLLTLGRRLLANIPAWKYKNGWMALQCPSQGFGSLHT